MCWMGSDVGRVSCPLSSNTGSDTDTDMETGVTSAMHLMMTNSCEKKGVSSFFFLGRSLSWRANLAWTRFFNSSGSLFETEMIRSKDFGVRKCQQVHGYDGHYG